MDAHPVPQNVTSFQFKLVGDMTLKQFIYLAAGVGIAYFIFVFLTADYPVVAWPLIVISTILGAAFAFLPIGSRPLDYWLGAFLKAIYSPTKRVWQKNKKSYLQDPLFKSRYVMFASTLHPQPPIGPILRPVDQTQPAGTLQVSLALSPPSPSNLPTQEELKKTVELARQAQILQTQIIQTERALDQIRAKANQPIAAPADYTEQVNKIMTDLQRLISQTSNIKSELDAVSHPEQTEPQVVVPKEKLRVVIPKKTQPQVALTIFPNVINGIVKNVDGDYLEGVVAVIYDKEGLPVRALKTNKLGQFSGSTPLPNGTYTLELEKEDLNFDALQIELDGQILPPLIITAKQ
ncbi:PrgI family protein [Candidatus Microgenomates bacterium]|nr:PrgI family protein [Candidatus Microgenomates bacterium]